jgi:hypothetical protein
LYESIFLEYKLELLRFAKLVGHAGLANGTTPNSSVSSGGKRPRNHHTQDSINLSRDGSAASGRIFRTSVL